MAGLLLLSAILLLDATVGTVRGQSSAFHPAHIYVQSPPEPFLHCWREDAKESVWWWIAAIVRNDDPTTIYCGGTLVADTWVLTAAHCIDTRISRYSVLLGVHRLTEDVTAEKKFNIVKSVIHHKYNDEDLSFDIALVQLERPVRVLGVGPYPYLGDSKDNYEGPCRVAGWGRITENDPLPVPRTLQEVAVPIVSNDSCKKSYPNLKPETICAGKSGKDSCQGDSGGPLMCISKDGSDEIWKLAGIVSYGRGCGQAAFPGVYTRVSSYRDFISNNIKGFRKGIRKSRKA